MSIGPVGGANAVAPLTPLESHVKEDDAATFGAMLGHGAGSAASGALSGFQAELGQAADAMSQLAAAPTAENFLAAQTTMMNAQGEFELGVKFAGQIEQDINKLTSLQ